MLDYGGVFKYVFILETKLGSCYARHAVWANGTFLHGAR